MAFLAGPLGKAALYGVLAVVLLGGVGVWFHEHDLRVLAQQAARLAAVVQVEENRQHAAAIVAVKEQHAAQLARLASTTSVKQVIARAPISQACVASAAVAPAIDELRRRSGSGAGQAGDPRGAPDVQSAARRP